jgi:hypothetical protein
MNTVPAPSLYQINTRVWLTELSRVPGERATLDRHRYEMGGHCKLLGSSKPVLPNDAME